MCEWLLYLPVMSLLHARLNIVWAPSKVHYFKTQHAVLCFPKLHSAPLLGTTLFHQPDDPAFRPIQTYYPTLPLLKVSRCTGGV